MKRIAVAIAFCAASLASSLAWAQTSSSSFQVSFTSNSAALTNANRIIVLSASAQPVRTIDVSTSIGNLIGIDFRVADSLLYGVTDTGGIYQIDFRAADGAPRLVSKLTTPFAGGRDSLMDFNPVVNALRLIGANNQNFAVVNQNGGNLNMTVAQKNVAYVAGDPNFGADPVIVAGAYNNNFVGATRTLFFMVDAATDSLVTIADLTATGSSNTAGGMLRTLGRIVDGDGAPIDIGRSAGLDIHTVVSGVNLATLVNGGSTYQISLPRFDPAAAPGTLQNVTARRVSTTSQTFIDIALITVPVF